MSQGGRARQPESRLPACACHVVKRALKEGHVRISQDGNAAFATLPYVVTCVHFRKRIRKSGFGKTKREKNTFLLLNPALSLLTPSVETKIERVLD